MLHLPFSTLYLHQGVKHLLHRARRVPWIIQEKSRNQSPATMWKGEGGEGEGGRRKKKGRKESRNVRGWGQWTALAGQVPLPGVEERVEREGQVGGRDGQRGKGSVAPEGYVWVLSRHIPFYHASGLRCPRSRCQENGRIFPLRARAPCLGRERLVLRALEEEEEEEGRGGGREERDGDRTGESGRRGKEENTKEKPGWAALRDRWLRWRDARLLDAINLDHKHRFTATLGVPRSFSARQHLSRSPGPLRATHFFKQRA